MGQNCYIVRCPHFRACKSGTDIRGKGVHCLEMCPHFSGVLVGRFHYTSYGVSGNVCTVIYRAWPTICSYSHSSPYISLASYYHNTYTHTTSKDSFYVVLQRHVRSGTKTRSRAGSSVCTIHCPIYPLFGTIKPPGGTQSTYND